MAGKDNLTPFTSDNAKEMQRKGAEKRKENNAKKKLMSQIYAEFLEREYSVRVGEKVTKKLTGSELVNECMKKVIARSDSSSVSLMREIRETLEGQKINLSGEVTTLQTTEERLAEYKKLIGEK